MDKYIICGKSGSGKDYLKSLFEKNGYNTSIPCTTRPKRKGELDERDYYFMEKEDFEHLIEKRNIFLEYQVFNNWYYGTLLSVWKQSDVFIMTPRSIWDIFQTSYIRYYDISIIYLDIDLKTRKQRVECRIGNADNIQRRLDADEKDFLGFEERMNEMGMSEYFTRITNPNFTFEQVLCSL